MSMFIVFFFYPPTAFYKELPVAVHIFQSCTLSGIEVAAVAKAPTNGGGGGVLQFYTRQPSWWLDANGYLGYCYAQNEETCAQTKHKWKILELLWVSEAKNTS